MKMPDGLLVGLFEWDGSREPVIIIGTDEDAIYKAAVPHCLYDDRGKLRLGWGGERDDEWLAEHPVPDFNDAEACKAWMLALGDHDDHRASTEFNIWSNGGAGVMAGFGAAVIQWVVRDADA